MPSKHDPSKSSQPHAKNKLTTPPTTTASHTDSSALQIATHAPESLTPKDIHTLQRTVGNRAVGALIQRLGKDGKKRVGRMDQDNVTVAEVEEWQRKSGLSDADADKVTTLGEAQLAEALTMNPADFTGASASSDLEEMFQTAKARSRSKTIGESASKASLGPAKSPVLIALNDRGIADDEARPFIVRAGAVAINPWLAATADDTIVRRMVVASNKSNKNLTEMNQVLVTANIHGYAVGELLDLMITHSHAAVLAALQATAAENRLRYLQLWMSYGVDASSPVQLKQLVRFQARLRDIPATVFTVYKKDTNYKGSKDKPSRTGFLRYNFGNETMEVHTHWNQTKKQLVSMHVQDNSQNGLEMNQWAWFADVATAVKNSHNTGAHAPTTNPAGGQLTLP